MLEKITLDFNLSNLHLCKNFLELFPALQNIVSSIQELKNLGVKIELSDDGFLEFCFPTARSEAMENHLEDITKSMGKLSRLKLVRQSNMKSIYLKVNSFLSEYYDAISKAHDIDAKMFALVRLVQNLHQFHLFADGNGRTFIFLLLNKLLIQNGMSPAFISYPGKFTGHDILELCELVREGQQEFARKNIEHLNNNSFLAYLHSEIVYQENEQKYMQLLSISFGREAMSKLIDILDFKASWSLIATRDFGFPENLNQIDIAMRANPSRSTDDIIFLVDLAILTSNDSLICNLLCRYNLNASRLGEQPLFLACVLKSFDLASIEFIFKHLKVSSAMIVETLLFKLNPSFKADIFTELTLFTDLVKSNSQIKIKYLLTQCSSADFNKILNHKFGNATGLELLDCHLTPRSNDLSSKKTLMQKENFSISNQEKLSFFANKQATSDQNCNANVHRNSLN